MVTGAALDDGPAAGIGHEAAAPELDPAARVALVAHAVDGADVDAVGNGVAPLDRFPGRLLLGAVLRLLRREPTDGGWVEQDLGAAQGGEARGLRVPLVPADQHPDAAKAGVPASEAEVARGEVELLVVLRIVGNVHLPVLA